jgi:hypothetical protein
MLKLLILKSMIKPFMRGANAIVNPIINPSKNISRLQLNCKFIMRTFHAANND